MSQDAHSLRRELQFIEDSFNSGIITHEEFEIAKKRIDAKLEKLKAEEETVKEEQPKPVQQLPTSSHTTTSPQPKVEPYHDSPQPQRTQQSVPVQNVQKKNVTKLETYGGKKVPSKKIGWWVLLLVALLIIIFAFNWDFSSSENKEEKPVEEGVPEEFSPECSTDLDCQREGSVGECKNPDERNAECVFEEAVFTQATVLTSVDCALCDTKRMTNTLTQLYPGVSFVEKDITESPIPRADIKALPAFIFDESVKETKRFETTKSTFIESGDFYLMKPSASGSSYFFKNPEKPKSVELFVTPFSDVSKKAFENLLDFEDQNDVDITVRFFTRMDENSNDPEVEEILRQLCIREEDNDKLLRYMDCAFDDESEECLIDANIQVESINTCMNNADSLLKEDVKVAEDLFINTAPVFVFNNQYKRGGSLSVDILEDVYCTINTC